MGVLEEHSAPGQAAGYFFQPERALYWLAKSPRGSRVGIEAGDDVTVETAVGYITEQDKSSICEKTDTLGNRSRDLWNTLSIWLKAINSGEINVSATTFIVATNKTFDETYIIKKMSNANTDEEAKTCISDLKIVCKKPPKTIEVFVNSVLSADEKILIELIKRIHLSDGSDKSYGQQLMEDVISLCHIPESLPAMDIVHALLGWLQESVLTLWRSGNPGWITRTAFDEQLERLKTNIREKIFKERIPELIPINSKMRSEKENGKFVKQILLVKENDVGFIVESIDDLIRANIEINRLSIEGYITKTDFSTFDSNLIKRWNMIFRNFTADVDDLDADDLKYNKILKKIGYKILIDTLNHRELLAGNLTEQYYLTRGGYHRHANMVDIGWHPFYDKLMKEADGGDTDEK